MKLIGEDEFVKFCGGIKADRASICKHNPLGTDEEILLWMMLGVLVTFLSLPEIETPCLSGKPDAETYRQAILFVLKKRKSGDFEVEKYLAELTEK